MPKEYLQYVHCKSSLIPMIGSQVIQGFGLMVDFYRKVTDKCDLPILRIRFIASDVHTQWTCSFNMIAINIAVKIALANHDQIIVLNKAFVEACTCWRSALWKIVAESSCQMLMVTVPMN
jgi:hypothetical protein